ncbi:MAG: hypothetical protein PWR06_2514 [Thermoanaerobacteraceae bacterium]|nr:hypothetical protein [Thermoanaerobacteraceae bacterium]
MIKKGVAHLFENQGSGFMYIKDTKLLNFTICGMLFACDFLIHGISKLKAKNVYEESWYLSLISAIFGLFAAIMQYFDAMGIREVNDFNLKFWWLYTIFFLTLAIPLCFKFNRRQIAVFNISKHDLEQILTRVFENHNFPIEKRDKDMNTILTIKDVNTVIVIARDDFSEDTYNLRFIGYRRLPYFDEILDEIKDLINDRPYKKTGLEAYSIFWLV